MAVTPNDLQMPDGPVVCFRCDEALTANQQAITFHAHRPGRSIILCRDCISPVLGSLVQDWASLNDFFYEEYPDRRDRLLAAFERLMVSIL